MKHMTWKQRSDYPIKGKGESDYPGAKGDMGIPPGMSIGKAPLGKGSDYPGEKGNKGATLPKAVSGSTSKEAASGD